MSCNSLAVHVDDFVFVLDNDGTWRGRMGRVAVCLQEDDEFFVLAMPMELLREISANNAVRSFAGAPILISARAVEQCNAWCWQGDDVVVLRK